MTMRRDPAGPGMQLAPTHYQANRTRAGVMVVRKDPLALRPGVDHSQSVRTRVGVMMVRGDSLGTKSGMKSLTSDCQTNGTRVGVIQSGSDESKKGLS